MNARQRRIADHARGRHVAAPIPDECWGCDTMRRVATIDVTKVLPPFAPFMVHLSRDNVTLCGRRSGAWADASNLRSRVCIRCARTRKAELDMIGGSK